MTKEDLLTAVWPDSYVTEGTLRQSVWEIREALGDHEEQQQLIKTIPKVGYQFVGEVRETQSEISPARAGIWKTLFVATAGLLLLIFLWQWRSLLEPESKAASIAVLPFDNLSPNPADEYFSIGMTEEIIANLSKIENLRVVSRTSVMRYKGTDKDLKEIAEELGVTAIVEGSARQAEGRVRITAQLIDARTDAQLWAKSYERELVRILEIQSDVARSIAIALKGELSRSENEQLSKKPPERIEAYDLVLRARYFKSREKRDQSTTYYEQAIKTDPSYAVPYAEVAANYAIDATWDLSDQRRTQRLAQAEEAVKKALELDDSIAEPHYALAMLRGLQLDWTSAERAFRTAIDLDPNHCEANAEYAMLLTRLGRYDEALKVLELAHKLEPFTLSTNAKLVWMYLHTGQSGKALEVAQMLVELHPEWILGYVTVALVYTEMGSFDRAFAVLDEARDKLDGAEANAWYIGMLGYLYALTGANAEAQDCLKRLVDIARDDPAEGGYSKMARIHMALGEQEKALDYLEKGDFWIVGGPGKGIAQNPLWDPLRSDPRFQALLQKLNLPEDSIRKPFTE